MSSLVWDLVGSVCVSFLLCLFASLSICLSVCLSVCRFAYSEADAHVCANLYAGSVSRPEQDELIEVLLCI